MDSKIILGILVSVVVLAVAITFVYAEYVKQRPPTTDYTCETTMDCDWCNKDCVNWKTYNNPPGKFTMECIDRDPMPGKSCQCSNGYCDEVPFDYHEGLVTFCSEEDWYKFFNEFPGTSKQLNAYLGEHCTGTYWYDGCELGYSVTDEVWDQYYAETDSIQHIIMECLSYCYDQSGKLIGGRVLYEIMYKIEDGALLEPECPEPDWCFVDVGCYDYSETQSCCYNEGFVNHTNRLSVYSGLTL